MLGAEGFYRLPSPADVAFAVAIPEYHFDLLAAVGAVGTNPTIDIAGIDQYKASPWAAHFGSGFAGLGA
jgi:hypothetical protein